MNKLECDFGKAMLRLYTEAKEECGYNATAFLQMLDNYGGLETAHLLLRNETLQYGFSILWERGRLDLTVECLVLDERFSVLFNDYELATARRRLNDCGFTLRPEDDSS